MSGYLRSIQDEYDDKGNYIGNSPEGNRFHGLTEPEPEQRLTCECGSQAFRPQKGGFLIDGCHEELACAGCGKTEGTFRMEGIRQENA